MKLPFCCLLLLWCHLLTAQHSPQLSVKDAVADIEYLITTFEEVHYSPYFSHSKEEIQAVKNRLMANWTGDSIPLNMFMASGMKLTAMMSGGHSIMDWQNARSIPDLKAHNYIPFTGKLLLGQDLFVVTRSMDPGIKPKARIKSVNGYDIVELFKECMAYVGGIETFKNATCEKMFPVYLFFHPDLHPPYTIAFHDNSEIVQSEGLDIKAISSFLNASLPQVDYSFEVIEGDIGLLTYNSCSNYKKFRRLLKRMFETIANENINKLIVDIRENGGGDSGLNDLLLAYLTQSPYQQSSGRYWKVSSPAKAAYEKNKKTYVRLFGADFMNQYMNTPNQEVIEDLEEQLIYPEKPKHFFRGKTCVLIGPNTFSSANFLADAVKTYKIATLIGTSTGEYTNDFGEQLSFVLPGSGAIVYVSSTYDIGVNGNADVLEPVHPDIEVKEHVMKFAIDWLVEKP
ncbi:MAG: hypothetical protein HRU12_23755 [Phaeodactylibacter sp.]|nr:hypothetical protein [Phaeodactylibacter sp.]